MEVAEYCTYTFLISEVRLLKSEEYVQETLALFQQLWGRNMLWILIRNQINLVTDVDIWKGWKVWRKDAREWVIKGIAFWLQRFPGNKSMRDWNVSILGSFRVLRRNKLIYKTKEYKQKSIIFRVWIEAANWRHSGLPSQSPQQRMKKVA